jgi:phage gp29-like protein
MRAVVNIGHAAAGIVPEGMAIEFKEAAKGTADPHLAMINWCEQTQSKVILGGTLTSGTDGGGSYALGKVHNEVRRDLLVSDAKQIQGTLTNGLMALIAQVNGLLADGSRLPRFEFDVNEGVDLALYADALPKLVGVGLPVPVAYALDKLRIPMAKEGEAVLGMESKTSLGSPSPALDSSAALSAQLNNAPVFTAKQQVIENLAADALAHSSSPIDEQAIFNAIKASVSYEDLADRLAVLLGESDSSEFEALLSRCTFAADCLGYAHAG